MKRELVYCPPRPAKLFDQRHGCSEGTYCQLIILVQKALP